MTFINLIISIGVPLASLAVYFLLFHDDVVEKRAEKNRLLQTKNEAEKIAKVKALSTNTKELEKFIVDNAKTLSDATIDVLVARMEMLAVDHLIRDDDLKMRIDDISVPKEYNPLVPEEMMPQKASKKKMKIGI